MSPVPSYEEYIAPLKDAGAECVPPTAVVDDLGVDSHKVVAWVDAIGERYGEHVVAAMVDGLDTATIGGLYEECFGSAPSHPGA